MLNKKLWVLFLREIMCQTKNRKVRRVESEGNVPLIAIILVVFVLQSFMYSSGTFSSILLTSLKDRRHRRRQLSAQHHSV
jgi:hypothetical protein